MPDFKLDLVNDRPIIVLGNGEVSLDAFSIVPHVRDLAIAYALSFLIGWDRERTERSAGLRTFPLVAIASCGFVQATEGILQHGPEGSARIVDGLITGIGFIGGGAIVRNGSSVRGTATAASLWATGAIGTAVGLGTYDVAWVISLFTIMTLRFLVPFKRQDTPSILPVETNQRPRRPDISTVK